MTSETKSSPGVTPPALASMNEQGTQSSDAAPVLDLQGISKAFPGVQALEDVDLVVRSGEVHALLGGNGAGKSTLVGVISGVLAPDSGSIRLSGEQVTFRTPRDSIDRGVAVIHQELMLVPSLSVAENIYLGREPRRAGLWMNWQELRRSTRAALQQVGLEVDPQQPVSALSPGAQQQVEIVRALAARPRILLMDEPTSALTRLEVDRLFQVIETLRQRGLAIIYITHSLDEVWRISDRLTVLRDGRVTLQARTDDVSRQQVAEAMVGQRLADWSFIRTVAPRTEPVLQCRSLRNRKLRDVTIEVRQGEVVGLAGALGSGRTTLLNALYGIVPLEGGEIRIEDFPVRIADPVIAIRMGLFLIPEDRKGQGVLLEMSVADNITLPFLDRFSRMGILSRSAQHDMVREAIRINDIKARGPAQPIQTLSGGNQQKAVLARWLSLQPRLLLLDQPTRGLDIGAKEDVYALIKGLAEQGVATLFAGTEFSELLRVCDRIYVLRDGSVAKEIVEVGQWSEADLFLATAGDSGG